MHGRSCPVGLAAAGDSLRASMNAEPSRPDCACHAPPVIRGPGGARRGSAGLFPRSPELNHSFPGRRACARASDCARDHGVVTDEVRIRDQRAMSPPSRSWSSADRSRRIQFGAAFRVPLPVVDGSNLQTGVSRITRMTTVEHHPKVHRRTRSELGSRPPERATSSPAAPHRPSTPDNCDRNETRAPNWAIIR